MAAISSRDSSPQLSTRGERESNGLERGRIDPVEFDQVNERQKLISVIWWWHPWPFGPDQTGVARMVLKLQVLRLSEMSMNLTGSTSAFGATLRKWESLAVVALAKRTHACNGSF
jgi:hypothetical protein